MTPVRQCQCTAAGSSRFCLHRALTLTTPTCALSTPLSSHLAAANDDAALAAVLLSKSPACLEAKNALEQAPFLFSCMVGSAEVALLLLQKGANVPSVFENTFHFTPRFYAQKHGMDAVLAALKAKGE